MRLFFLGALVVVLEWSCARWFPAHVADLAHVPELTPVGCLAGVGLGCLLASRKISLLPLMPIVLFAAMASVFAFGEPLISFDSDDAWASRRDEEQLPAQAVYSVALMLMFAGLGQELGRSLLRSSDRTRGFLRIFAGMTAGFCITSLAAWLDRSPPHWFGPIVAITIGLLWVRPDRPSRRFRWMATLAVLLAAGTTLRTSGHWPDTTRTIVWTGWGRFNVERDGDHFSNGADGAPFRQRDNTFSDRPEEAIPFILRDELAANLPPFRKILLIGSDFGHGLSTVLRWTDKRTTIDLVEELQWTVDLARENNPGGPLDDPRVRVHVGSRLEFVHRRAVREPNSYDLVLLGSCGTNCRIPLPEERIRDFADCLKPDGWFVFSLNGDENWQLVRYLRAFASRFGREPLVLTSPPTPVIVANPRLPGRTFSSDTLPQTVVIAGRKAGLQLLEVKMERVARDESVWLPPLPDPKRETDYLLQQLPKVEKPPASLVPWRNTTVEDLPADSPLRAVTEDWPYGELAYPDFWKLPLVKYQWPAVVLLVSLVFVRYPRSKRPGFPMSAFFLGAAMTPACFRAQRFSTPILGGDATAAQLAFLLVCLMLTLGILIAIKWEKLTGRAVWAAFAACLVLNLLVPLRRLAELPEAAKIALALLLLFAPILTGGMLLAKRLPGSDEPANWAGSFCLGLASGFVFLVLSVMFGFHALVAVSLVLFAVSSLWARSTNATGVVKS